MGSLTCPTCRQPLQPETLKGKTVYTCPRCPSRPWALTVNDRRFLRSLKINGDADQAPQHPIGPE